MAIEKRKSTKGVPEAFFIVGKVTFAGSAAAKCANTITSNKGVKTERALALYI
jgi:hypothetical protein